MLDYRHKLIEKSALIERRETLRREGRIVVFTNGCFDILHRGHVEYLTFARNQGDVLIVGLNADASVRRAKGPERPVNGEADRAAVLAALACVDYITVFEEDEPAALIATLLPDVLVKGEDWAHYVSGREAVEAAGGRVVLAPLTPGRSTTRVIDHIRKTSQQEENPCQTPDS